MSEKVALLFIMHTVFILHFSYNIFSLTILHREIFATGSSTDEEEVG